MRVLRRTVSNFEKHVQGVLCCAPLPFPLSCVALARPGFSHKTGSLASSEQFPQFPHWSLTVYACSNIKSYRGMPFVSGEGSSLVLSPKRCSCVAACDPSIAKVVSISACRQTFIECSNPFQHFRMERNSESFALRCFALTWRLHSGECELPSQLSVSGSSELGLAFSTEKIEFM